ncbi:MULTISPECIES: dihydroxyacetone kinase subunit DhaL [Tetragenococcus]|uniref:phosphoenolpyruvate--glycerone phosphotransferase n=2 Tax=Tetragenococcus TaxID=51668 RepID=A0A3G5FHH4_TETHA|nr:MULTISPECIES: dihydroxyacetone kinase subunit DhaL [Tetragenococcus]MDN6470165.1 dihydroxyacetone kinase subunit L [Enterococcaceae bacterium]AYW49782.1 dihydroxyacetone kinase subunit L [Tetragenococcus halophilus]KFN93243.1 phosphoenolpyruvate-dihydroxyacetone phosphotransferase ADP-binding subunit [Tetragenococcus muriaticus PMC-11-5]MCF1601474.1 dihydroxyacetone kinase subunit L [Tetragenococcus halophilus]MCF1675443.1 dihydroxyacetone kinase subunit L [Tetragenococcus halophilus]
MQLTAQDVQAWLAEFTDKIKENKQYLSDLDTPIGDGDHGNNMARGVNAYEASFEQKQPESISDILQVFSMAMISKVGGASGPLYGSALMNMVKETKGTETIDSYEQLGNIIEQGLAGIKKRGKTEFEDKTMVDVWEPVVQALKEGSLAKEQVERAEEYTQTLVAKKGRASYLAGRSKGHIDPGAASSALFFDALVDAIK